MLLVKIRTYYRSLFKNDFKSIVRLLTYMMVIAVFLLGTYFLFNRIFAFLLKYEEIGFGMIYRIFSLMFSMFFALLLMSSIISSISTFFRTRELEFLFSTPINVSSLFFTKLIENGVFASWATAIISFPLIIALGQTFNASFSFYLLSILDFLILVIISTSIGLILTFLFSGYFLRHSIGGVVLIVVIIAIAIILMIFFGKAPQIFNLPQTANLQEVNNYIASLEVEQFKYLPSGFAAQAIFNRLENINNLSQYIPLLMYILGIIPLILLSMFMYRKKFISFSNIASRKKTALPNRMKANRITGNGLIPMLIQKDLLMFLRNPSQWGQSLIFLTLLAFYIFSLIRSPMYFRTPFFTYIIAFANMGFSAYISATLSVRFIFPIISLEGRSFDIIKMHVPMRDYFISKLLFNFIVVLILGEMLVFGTNVFLELDSTVVLLSSAVIFILSIGITFINIGIGAIFPEFNENNPSKIASGFGGIIAAIFSLTYVGIAMGILAGPIRTYFEYQFRGIQFNNMYFLISLSIITVLTLIIAALITTLSLRKLRSVP